MSRPVTAIGRELLDALASQEGRELLRSALASVTPPPDDTLLTIDEAAKLTRRSRAAIYKAIARGTMPGVVRQGGRVMLARAALVGGGR